jgi:hypothetical protein
MKNANLLAALLLSVSSLLFTRCTADHDFVSTPREILSEGAWGVKSFYAGGDKTGNYAAYSFSFQGNGIVTVTNISEEATGRWRWIHNVQNEVLDLQLGDHADLNELGEQWTLTMWDRHHLTLTRNADVLTLESLR